MVPLLPPEDPDEAPPAGPAAPPVEPDEVPPEDALPGPPVSEEAPGGQSLLLIDEVEEDELPLELPLLGEVDSLPGGQFEAAVEPEALLLGELVSDELVLGELLSGELVLGELVLGELEYEPLDCAIAPAENASSALAVAAASNLSFMRGTPFQECIDCDAWLGSCATSIAHAGDLVQAMFP